MDLLNKIKHLATEYKEEITEIRHHLHKYPELSFKEYNTSNFIANKLKAYGISYKQGFAGTGITAIIQGRSMENIIAMRADMDALPVREENKVAYKSVNEGIMHACGHDAHVASLLGTAKILNEIKAELNGSVMLIFQPGEELLPGGAKLMIEEGALKNPEPGIIIGQHVMPNMETGKAGFRCGIYMASADEIYITVKGKGGHAAMPEDITDTVLIASHVIVNLQMIKFSEEGSSIPTVLSFGKVIANGTTNVVPDEVKIEGTCRTINEAWRKKVHEKIKETAIQTSRVLGGDCDVRIINGYPILVNDKKITNEAIKFGKEYLGEENIVDLPMRMTAEDFSYYSQLYPATFYRLGTMKKGVTAPSPQHNSTFDVDDEALETGMGFMAWLGVSFLNKNCT